MSESASLDKPYPPKVSLILRGKELDPKKIDEMLGINSYGSFKQGDKRPKDNNKWTFGFWMFSSSEKIESMDLMVHIKWLLEQLEPVQTKLKEILKDETIEAELDCFWIMPSTHEEIILEPELLRKIAQLGIPLALGMYSPDD